MSTGVGPLWRIDGPPPLAPQFGLLQSARSPVVRIIPDADERGIERWINGVEVYPYPADPAFVFDSCAVHGEDPPTKEFGETAPLTQYDALTVYLAETCTSSRVPDQEAFKARAVAALSAVEGAAVEREFQSGDVFAGNPHLSDGNGTFPNDDTATSVVDGFAILENEIASSGKQGIIHCSPGMAMAAVGGPFMIEEKQGVLRTINGTLVVPGYGYAAGSDPAGHSGAAGTEEWVYASGPVDIRQSNMFTTPETVAEALDRGSEMPNAITYRVERYFLPSWDTTLQSAVLIDRCLTTCEAPT